MGTKYVFLDSKSITPCIYMQRMNLVMYAGRRLCYHAKVWAQMNRITPSAAKAPSVRNKFILSFFLFMGSSEKDIYLLYL